MSDSTELKPVTIIRKAKKNNFTLIHNSILKDSNLSWKATGILCYLLHLPDDWEFHKSQICDQKTDGETSFESGWKELKERGYITSDTIRNGKGHILKWIWTVHEEPVIQKENTTTKETQVVDTQDQANHPPTNTNPLPSTKTPPPIREKDGGGGLKDLTEQEKQDLEIIHRICETNNIIFSIELLHEYAKKFGADNLGREVIQFSKRSAKERNTVQNPIGIIYKNLQGQHESRNAKQ